MSIDSLPKKHRGIAGRDLIKRLAPLLEIADPNRVEMITLTIPYDDLVTANVVLTADTRLLDFDWQPPAPSADVPPKGKSKHGSTR